jgi:isopenicillin-N N-acyltransferase-like protein
MTGTIQQLQVCGSHHQVGLAIGKRFAPQIHRALDGYAFLQGWMLPYHRSPAGQARYRVLLDLNQARYPGYIAELEGIAEGSGRPFDELFLVNMRGEYKQHVHCSQDGCFDLAVLTAGLALIGHNEDASPAFRDNVYVVRAQIHGQPAFTALSYPGFLCGNAFGFNAAGICFSVDSVQPRDSRCGLGRHFLARSLFEAQSIDEAINRITVPGRALGFSYTIGSVAERRIVHLEVAPETHHVREIAGCYLHANHYRELAGVEQVVGPSSQARLSRAQDLVRNGPPSSAAGVLAILGDEDDTPYPIYRTAVLPDQGATLCTALFDLDAGWLRVYTGHPTRDPTQFVELAM